MEGYNERAEQEGSMVECKHWACNLADGTCVGCGATICRTCLKEPDLCKCENRHDCCGTAK